MSKRKHNTKRSRKAANVTNRTLPPRHSRHGVLLTDVYRVKGEEVTRVETKQDPKTGEFKTRRVVVRQAENRPMTEAEMSVARTRLRATESTVKRGAKNVLPTAKPKPVATA